MAAAGVRVVGGDAAEHQSLWRGDNHSRRRQLLSVAVFLGLLAGCGNTKSAGERFDEGMAKMEAEEEAAYPPLKPSDFSTTITCGHQGVFPNATGQLTNRTNRSLGFEIWVAFKTSDGEVLDYSNAFARSLAAGESGDWETLTHVKSATDCEVVCVDQIHSFNRNERANCRRYADAT